MRKVILSMSMSLDGFVTGDRQHPGALPEDDELIDEYRPAVQPVAVGSGKALFGHLPAAQYLTLVEAKPFACGVVVHIYTPQQGPAAEWPPAGGTDKEG